MMAGNGISYLLAATAGWWLLRRRGLRGPDTGTAPTAVKATAAAFGAALTAATAAYLAGQWLDAGKLDAVAQLTVAGPVLIATYLALAHAIRLPEARQLAITVRRKVSAGPRR